MTPKRSLSPASEGQRSPKRTKVDNADQEIVPSLDGEPKAVASLGPTQHAHARLGLQRSIAMVLKHDGFHTASPEAMESFTSMVETYMESLIEQTKIIALSARREHVIPTDMEQMLRRHNIRLSGLRPHLRPPIPKPNLVPTFADVHIHDDDAYTTLPLLGQELSGQPDKEEKEYIPSSFPEFPSKHTYKFTPQEDVNVRDPKTIREEAARTAQQGEAALRRLVRASKMRKQKEVKLLVERDAFGKERFRLWESTMKRFTGTENRGESSDQSEIADHSMIVNGDTMFARKEVPRLGKRSALAGKK